MSKKIKYIVILSLILMCLYPVSKVDARAKKIPILDETSDGIQSDEAKKGFVIYNLNAKGRLIIVVKAHKLLQKNAEFTVELITAGDNPDGGISDTEHYGNVRNELGSIETNIVGNGNSHFKVMVDELEGADSEIDVNYGHIDLEDYTGTLGVPNDYYGATPMSWLTNWRIR
jgi:hypothetical protein